MPLSVQKLLTVCSTVVLLALISSIGCCSYHAEIARDAQRIECVKAGETAPACRELLP